MKIQELMEKTTPLPWHRANQQGMRDPGIEIFNRPYGLSVAGWMMSEEDASFTVHCCSNFMKALEGLKKLESASGRYVSLDGKVEPKGPQWLHELIAALEEVKGI